MEASPVSYQPFPREFGQWEDLRKFCIAISDCRVKVNGSSKRKAFANQGDSPSGCTKLMWNLTTHLNPLPRQRKCTYILGKLNLSQPLLSAQCPLMRYCLCRNDISFTTMLSPLLPTSHLVLLCALLLLCPFFLRLLFILLQLEIYILPYCFLCWPVGSYWCEYCHVLSLYICVIILQTGVKWI